MSHTPGRLLQFPPVEVFQPGLCGLPGDSNPKKELQVACTHRYVTKVGLALEDLRKRIRGDVGVSVNIDVASANSPLLSACLPMPKQLV